MIYAIARLDRKDRATRGAHAAQALVLIERLRCASDIIKRQSSIFNSGLSGLGFGGFESGKASFINNCK